MPTSVQELVNDTIPEQTVLIFGAGASIPSGSPSVAMLIEKISTEFGIPPDGLTLAEISGLAERKRNRKELISLLRKEFKNLRPKGSILNLPLYNWKSIYSTNYDELVEDSYKRVGKSLISFSSNFDFTIHDDPNATKLFKIHGTIAKDISDGNASRIILTDMDYDQTQDYREALYLRLATDLTSGPQVIIVGQSLADPDLKDIVQKAIETNQKAMAGGRISLLLHTQDLNRALLFEARGLRIAFGGLDEFFAALSSKAPDYLTAHIDTGDILDSFPSLRPVSYVVADEFDASKADVSAIFNGWPAKFAELAAGYTFDRTIASEIFEYLKQENKVCAVLLGASGVGKTTAARQVIVKLKATGFYTWEHKTDHPLNVNEWLGVAQRLSSSQKSGVLLIDDAHSHLHQVNDLIDRLAANKQNSLKIILTSTRNHWVPRIKSPSIYALGQEFGLSKLTSQEIDRLLTLVQSAPLLRSLVEAGFGGFSLHEQRRRLIDRCEADMFVCLKNIFASEKFDDIILREYASLDEREQEVYRSVAAMEYAGIRVHRQLVIRLLSIPTNEISHLLACLDEIISEYEVNRVEGIYGWRVRHYVIASIIAKYKFFETGKIIDLFNKVIDQISPTYDIEIRTIRELCNIESGLSVIPDKQIQNTLLRKMMSIAPGERVPRHRLIRNLIELGEFEKAESEIRIFEKDFKRDGPVIRYRILLSIARATHTADLLQEDRVAILEQARELAATASVQFENNKSVLGAYCELGVETFRLTGSHMVYDTALDLLKKAEVRLGDPEITKMIMRYQRRIAAHNITDEES
ncbi:hypothetical protein CUZ56_01216 [Saezia sanguinis]|uniref:AAA+ ATPase domain-containing protein n=1 Tax=Saezia sanguinis TaxID=1965230 RepID=A0A433SEW0_9BURK|nr:SIR2 family protein [Saezia sanguinis]RUS67273.1 hypothetical protein CUZ56_01216 [Saezia sanguinis]